MSLPTVSGTARILTEPTRRTTAKNDPMSTVLLKFQGWRKGDDGKWIEGDAVVAGAIAFGDVALLLAGFAKGDDVEVSGTATLQVWKEQPRMSLTLKSVAAVEKRQRDRESVAA